jgi:L-rhamnose isomerase
VGVRKQRTRFKVFGQPGVPRTPYEKADDAAHV